MSKGEGRTGYEEAKARIRKAAAKRSRELNLGGLGLTSLPPEIWQLTALQVLVIYSNELTSLPSEIGQLKALEELNLQSNQLVSLPSEIGQLAALHELNLGNNQLKSLPSEIGRLKALDKLYLHINQLTSLPSEIGQLTAMVGLAVSENQLTSLPSEIGQLKSLEKLYLNGNQLTSLPTEIGQLKALRELVLENNNLTSLPEGLRTLKRLAEFCVHANPAFSLPTEVLGPTWMEIVLKRKEAAPPSEIIAYALSLQEARSRGEVQPLNEAKVLFLGQPESGKSSLIHALKHGTPTPNFEQTDGITQEVLPLTTRDGELADDGEPFRLNLWDFGGQEIYKATHRFFLTKGAVYVLVTTARKDTRVDADLEEWLETAKTFGDGSPVWIVINKHDENPTGGPSEDELIRKFHPMLRGFIRTQCQDAKDGPNKGKGAGFGIDELRKTLLAEVWKLPDARQEMHPDVMKLKAKLEELDRPTLTLEEYTQLCGDTDVTNSRLQTGLLNTWDKLGTVRYFPDNEEDDDPTLRQTAILNPEWVTEAVYRVLGDETLKKRGGLVREADFARISKELNHPVGSHRLVEKVMRRFSQLYDTGEGKMFIPLLLEDREPKMDWPGDSLPFLYRYPVLPPGLIPTFIARTHNLHSKAPPPWRKGCVLEIGDCRVRVIGDKRLRKVEISVVGGRGSQRRDALDRVRFKFEELHEAVTGLDAVEELIPVPEHPEAPFLSYKFLRTLEDRGIRKHLFPADAKQSDLIEVDIAEALGCIRGTAMAEREEERRQAMNVTVMGDLVKGDKMRDFQPVKTGDVINSQVGHSLENCTNMIQQQQAGERKDLLEQLDKDVKSLLTYLSEDEQEEATDLYEKVVKHATKQEPSRRWYSVSAKGLLDASKWAKDFTGNIVGTIGQLGKVLFPDFSIEKDVEKAE
ncbi:MAG: COR domain-containing protein [Planctomycetota bacterium]